MRCFQALFRALIAPAIFGFVVASVLPASAAVYSSRQALPADTIQQFLANPAALLSQYPNGGPQMIARISGSRRLGSGDGRCGARIAQERQ